MSCRFTPIVRPFGCDVFRFVKAALDIQYLSSRFQKGQKWAEEFTNSKHRIVAVPSLSDGQADLIARQSAQSAPSSPRLA